VTASVKQKHPETSARSGLFAVILFVVSFLVYSNTLNHDFAGDDPAFIADNKNVQQGIRGIPAIFTSSLFESETGVKDPGYRPLVSSFFAIEKALFGGGARHYHWMNVFCYALGCVLAFLFLKTLLGQEQIWTAFLAALLFAVHPVHTEVVANIKSRDEIFGFIGSVTALLFVLKYGIHRRAGYLWISTAAFTFAVFSKESALATIALIPLTLHFFSSMKPGAIVRTTLVHVPPVILFLLMRRHAVGDAEMGLTVMLNSLTAASSTGMRIASALLIQLKYLQLFVFPHPLSMDYSYRQIPLVTFASWQVWLMITILILSLSLVVVFLRHKKPAGYLILFYMISFSMTGNMFVLIGTTLAERLLFTPSLALCALAALLFHSLYSGIRHPVLKKAVAGCLAVLLLAAAVRTLQRNRDWKNNAVLIPRTLETAPRSARAHFLMGREFLRAARQTGSGEQKARYLHEAIRFIEQGIDIFDGDKFLFFEQGNAYREMEAYDRAADAYTKACAIDSGFYYSWFLLGNSYIKTREYTKALEALLRAENIQSGEALLYSNIGYAYRMLHDYEKAIISFEKALEINHQDPYPLEQLVKVFQAYKPDSDKAVFYRNRLAAAGKTP